MARVDALIEAIRDQDRSIVVFVREALKDETHPHVLATMASVIGQLGKTQDATELVPLFHHEDTRVVANALDAARRLAFEVDLFSLSVVMDHDDPRITANAIALLAVSEAGIVCNVIEKRFEISAPRQRCSLAHVLAVHGLEPGRTRLMLQLLEGENQPLVIQSLLESLSKIADAKLSAEFSQYLDNILANAGESKAELIRRWSNERERRIGNE